MLLGSHVGMSGKLMLLGSVLEADSYGANCFMVYTGAPQNTIRKNIDLCLIDEAHAKMKELNINPNNCIVHAPYIVNLATSNIEKYEFAISFISEEVRRTYKMGFKNLVIHPGAALKDDPMIAVHNVARAFDQIIENTIDMDVTLCIETMAGKGTEVGINFDQIAEIINTSKYPERIGVCFDTCHTHDSGYDIKNNFDAVLKEFDEKVGINKITCMHINDSMNSCGAKKDRHANIGYGFIGFDALNHIVHHEQLKHVPKFLESPYVTESTNSTDKTLAPYKQEIEMLRKGKFNSELIEDIRNYYIK